MWGYIEDTPGGRGEGGEEIGATGEIWRWLMEMRRWGHIILEAADSDKLGKRGAAVEIINNSAIVPSA